MRKTLLAVFDAKIAKKLVQKHDIWYLKSQKIFYFVAKDDVRKG